MWALNTEGDSVNLDQYSYIRMVVVGNGTYAACAFKEPGHPSENLGIFNTPTEAQVAVRRLVDSVDLTTYLD